MSFNFNAFKDRVQGECYLLLEFIKISFQEEQFKYHNKKKKRDVLQIWDRNGFFQQQPNLLGLYIIFLFMTLYKMIDQLFEQILEDNGERPKNIFWSYKEKIKRINSIRTKSNLVLPKLLKKYPKIFDGLFVYYDTNKEARNSIAHRGIEIVDSKNFFVKFKDITNSTEFSILIHPSFISERYFLLKAITEDFPEYSIIDFKKILKTIEDSQDQTIKISELINKLGIVYETEIKWNLEKLIKNNLILENRNILSFP